MVNINLFGTTPKRAAELRLSKQDQVNPASNNKRNKASNKNKKASKNQEREKNKKLGALDRKELFEPFFFSIPLDLGEVLRKPFMRNQFREFLRKRLAHENLLFFETIEMYQKIDQAPWRRVAGEQMVSKFIENEAPYHLH